MNYKVITSTYQYQENVNKRFHTWPGIRYQWHPLCMCTVSFLLSDLELWQYTVPGLYI